MNIDEYQLYRERAKEIIYSVTDRIEIADSFFSELIANSEKNSLYQKLAFLVFMRQNIENRINHLFLQSVPEDKQVEETEFLRILEYVAKEGIPKLEKDG